MNIRAIGTFLVMISLSQASCSQQVSLVAVSQGVNQQATPAPNPEFPLPRGFPPPRGAPQPGVQPVKPSPGPVAPAPTPVQPVPTQPPAPAPAEPSPPPFSPFVADSGVITPTVYYTPVYKESDQTCDPAMKVDLLSPSGTSFMKVCPKIAASCGLQGTCFIEEGKALRRFNVVSKIKGIDRYREMGPQDCQYGFGVMGICLDPFYSVAADLKIYNPGDVIYIESIKGLALPDGTKHSGYFVIRDQGSAIKGKGRFDFFSGFLSYTNAANPFVKAKLGDKTTHYQYSLITGDRAIQARKSRHYPR